MKLLILTLIFLLKYTHIKSSGHEKKKGIERLPRVLSDQGYKLLFGALSMYKLTISRSSTTAERRTYRLARSGHYHIRKIINPITSENEKVIVSIILDFV